MVKELFGKLSCGSEVFQFTLENKNNVKIKIINYGGIITSIITPDKTGKLSDIVLGFDDLSGYQQDHPYFGTLVGRFANRIAGGKFTLQGKGIQLAKNNGENHLHGGNKGFDKVIWDFEIEKRNDVEVLKLIYFSKDGEENYPGNLKTEVEYSLSEENELRIQYHAVTDKDTIINLTNHSYFNLSGEDTILNHELKINADSFTPIDATLIPNGEVRKVANTPMDFSKFEAIGRRINENYDQLVFGMGYDHNFIINETDDKLKFATEARDSVSGRKLEVFTTQPGVQFYSGNFLDGLLSGKNGKKYQKRSGFCLETQHYPDSPNKSQFPSVVLKPEDEYNEATIYKFGLI